MPWCAHLISDTDGAAAIEYALVAVFISLAAIVALELAGVSLTNVFTSVAESIPAGS
ncbi:MAG TPA: Flp family type IVb pilin [Sphingomonadales bacterium]|nr:Flp family type IVb pilin [Sphingomonadales bacterium]